MSQPVWQSNYVDLCEETTVRFGAACVICGARYATPVETIARELVASAAPGSPLAQELADLKYQRFTEFDGAFRELSITCYRCGRAACPDCWDDDNRMCAECVVARGLTRSPRVGPPGRSPLQDGRLERVASGRHSDVGRPAWLNQLLETGGAARVGYVPPAAPPVPWLNDANGPSMPNGHDGFDASASLAMPMPTPMPFSPVDSSLFAGEPTNRMPIPGPATDIGDEPLGWGLAQMEPYNHEHFETSEGSATSNMVSCPRCGTANYDFVTRCTVCQLQLIQICPACEKLNAGHVKECEFCGASLKQPQGWSGVQEAIKPVPPEEVSQKRRAATPMPMPLPMPAPITPDQFMPPMPPMPPMSEPRPRLRKTAPQARSTGAPAFDAVGAQPAAPAAFAMPAMPALGPFEAPGIAPPHQHPRRSRNATDTLINSAERLASLVLVAVILVIIGGIVAAEVSAKADAFITSLIHIDIRVTIAHFIQQVQRLTNRDS